MILIPVNPSLSRYNPGNFADPRAGLIVIPRFPEIPAQSGSGKIRVRVSSRSWPFDGIMRFRVLARGGSSLCVRAVLGGAGLKAKYFSSFKQAYAQRL